MVAISFKEPERLTALTHSSENTMRPRKTPTSSLSGSYASHSSLHYLTVTTVTAVELLVNRIWYRAKARMRGISWGGASPGTGTTIPSPARRLPHEIVEMIIACLIHDTPSLRSCSLTCHSWYIAAIPHLYLTLDATINPPTLHKSDWPNPVRYMHALGLLPSVETVRIRSFYKEFSPKQFDRSTLRHFSALANVQSLEMDNLDIPSFISRIQKYFGPLLPTLRSLYLKTPKGSNRQIIFFVGSFHRLEDLTLESTVSRREPEEDLTLVPPFTPPLQGRLAVCHWTRAGLFQDMVHLFGGMRFRALDLFGVDQTRFLLRACPETLQVLKLYPTDLFGERSRPNHVRFQANDFIAMTRPTDFDLSWNRSLQVLEVPAYCLTSRALRDGWLDANFLKYVLSTIQSPAFSRVDLGFQERDFYFLKDLWLSARPHPCELSGRAREEVWSQQAQFGLLREVRKAREFSLVLYVDIQGPFGDFVVRMLKEVVAAEKARGGFDDFFPEPLVTSDPLPLSSLDP